MEHRWRLYQRHGTARAASCGLHAYHLPEGFRSAPRTSLMMAATLRPRHDRDRQCRREPEVADLANCLIKMGAKNFRRRHLDDHDRRRRQRFLGARHPRRCRTVSRPAPMPWPSPWPAAMSCWKDAPTRASLETALETLRRVGADISATNHGIAHQTERRGHPAGRHRHRPPSSRASRPTCRRSSWR